METTPDIQELAIILAVSNHNPTLLTPDFLAGSGIVPLDWELSRPPVLSAQAAQVAFTNGINIVAQPGSVTFSESTSGKETDAIAVANIAMKYAATLPNLDYRAISISPKRFATFESRPDDARKFITATLLSPGSWQDFGTDPLQASLTLVYTVDQRQLRLSIAEARLQLPDKEPISAILFAGSFQYDIVGETSEEKLKSLYQLIQNWHADLETYNELIETRFLNPVEIPCVLPIKAAG